MLLCAIAAVVLVGLSPHGLNVFGGAAREWERLSFIGQTYGAVSALIAVLALVGVAVTLVFQARETRRAVDESRRQAMGELLRMAMDDPDLDACWGPVPPDEDLRERRQLLYTNMIVTQWATAFRAGAIPEKRLRANAAEMFQGSVGRAYWAAARTSRLENAGRRRERRFNEILDDAYRSTAAVQAPTAPTVGPTRKSAPSPRAGALGFGAGVVVAGVAAAAIGAVLRRKARPAALGVGERAGRWRRGQ